MMILNPWLKLQNQKSPLSTKSSSKVNYRNQLILLKLIAQKEKEKEKGEEEMSVLDNTVRLFVYQWIIIRSVSSEIEEWFSCSGLSNWRLRSFSCHWENSFSNFINMSLIFRWRTVTESSIDIEQFLDIFLNNSDFCSINLNLSQMLEIAVLCSWSQSL